MENIQSLKTKWIKFKLSRLNSLWYLPGSDNFPFHTFFPSSAFSLCPPACDPQPMFNLHRQFLKLMNLSEPSIPRGLHSHGKGETGGQITK